ncbi:GNAT family N-acetyltransferase [Agrococcus jejuensis]|uniref:L-amino acid N-acyltransferase YncA n=1 Tax=Agrococcus jejuensis TaxID=399736 RepID=A0A1G8BWU9_9MICO|nr:GNAT family N-acetyltransferase [Agrococcus jejuensis]SDH37697.1 L-amino acid N-acyltransferase YncA [Agrococcus jejuensis]
MTLAFRDATVADAAAVARIHVTAWRQAYAGLIHQPVLDALDVADRTASWTRWLERSLAGEGTDGDVRHAMLVAERDGEVVGWATYGPARRRERDGWGELAGFYVDPLAARSGIGRAMMAEVEARLAAAGFERAYLWVLEGNAPAEAAYSRYGWEPDGATLDDPDTDPTRTLVDHARVRILPAP